MIDATPTMSYLVQIRSANSDWADWIIWISLRKLEGLCAESLHQFVTKKNAGLSNH